MATFAALLLPAPGASARDDAPPRSAIGWREEWPRFRAWEYVYTTAALGTGLSLRFLVEPRPQNWQGGILFDDAILDRVALENPENRRSVQRATDVLFYGSMAYRAVDSLVVPLVGYSDPTLALQMSMIDLESFGTVALVLWGSQAFVRRERPQLRRCNDPRLQPGISTCDPDDIDRNRSFIAGHAATVLTAAGLTCMHHAHNPLYGGAADTIACGSWIGAAGVMGALRLWNEAHYPTDLVLGYALGAFTGWFMPAALHYGFGGKTPQRAGRRPAFAAKPRGQELQLSVLPLASQDELGAAVVGVF